MFPKVHFLGNHISCGGGREWLVILSSVALILRFCFRVTPNRWSAFSSFLYSKFFLTFSIFLPL